MLQSQDDLSLFGDMISVFHILQQFIDPTQMGTLNIQNLHPVVESDESDESDLDFERWQYNQKKAHEEAQEKANLANRNTYEDETERQNKELEEYDKYLEEFNRKKNETISEKINDEVVEFEGEFKMDLPNYKSAWKTFLDKYTFTNMFKTKNIKWFLKSFRWAVNIVVIAIPWFFWSIAFVVYNVVMNIWLNKWWAGGNWWLLGNTMYAIIQMMMSWPLIFELPIYLRHFKAFRWLSLFSAVIFNTFWFILLADWIHQIWGLNPDTYENIDLMQVLINMTIVYNCILHISIIPINFAIIVKEIELGFYQMIKTTGEVTTKLMFNKMEINMEDTFWWMNPIHLIQSLNRLLGRT